MVEYPIVAQDGEPESDDPTVSGSTVVDYGCERYERCSDESSDPLATRTTTSSSSEVRRLCDACAAWRSLDPSLQEEFVAELVGGGGRSVPLIPQGRRRIV